MPIARPVAALATALLVASTATAAGAQAVADTVAPPALVAALGRWAAAQREAAPARYRFALAALDADAHPDAVVLLLGPEHCGTGGCTLVVFRGTRTGFRTLSTTAITREPVRLGAARSHGLRTLIVNTRGAGDVVLAFDGRRYPGNPSLQRAATRAELAGATTLIAP